MSNEKNNHSQLVPHQWKPGQSGNPTGRPTTPDEIRVLMYDKSVEFKKRFLYWVEADVQAVVECRGAPWEITAIDRMITSAIVQGMNGNDKAMHAILDRLFGKPKEQVEMSGPNGEPIEPVTVVLKIPRNGREGDE